jgi:predicted MFS family arabinose efflux permease
MLVIKLFWAALAIACYSFASAYVIRLGGSNLHVSLITSAAALVNALTSIPFAIFLERRSQGWPWVVGSLWALRIGHLGLIAIPLLPAFRAEAVVALLLLVNITINTLIFNIAFWMGTSLQPIYFVRELNATDGWIGLWLGLISSGAILGNLIWPRLINRHGYAWVLGRATLLSAAYYFLIGFFPDLNLILAFAPFFGMVSPGVDISHFTTLLEVCDPERRALYVSIFVMGMNAGFFLSALLAALLLELIDAQTLVLILAGLRLTGALLFRINPVRSASLA